MCEAEGSAEGMTHAKVLAWLARSLSLLVLMFVCAYDG
jgi:hypothetical protein